MIEENNRLKLELDEMIAKCEKLMTQKEEIDYTDH